MAGVGGGQSHLFSQAVSTVMKEWQALKIAVDNAFGGPYSQEKALWLEEVTVDFMCNNADVQSWELEDYLAVLMDQEFNTSVEDASIQMISKKICDLYRQYQIGNIQLIQDFIAKSQPAPSVDVQCIVQEDEVVGLDIVKEEEEEEEKEVEKDLEQLKLVEDTSSTAVNEKLVDDDEGWEVVKKKKKGRHKPK